MVGVMVVVEAVVVWNRSHLMFAQISLGQRPNQCAEALNGTQYLD